MRLIRQYPVVMATIAVGLLVAGFLFADQPEVARWTASVYALGVAAYESVGMIRDIRHGRWGIDILAVTAIVSTIAVGEYIASLIIVLMLSGGKALEDYAAGRAKRELNALLDRAPQIAHRYVDGGTVEDAPISEIAVGDTLMLRPSEVVPVDGELLSPEASFDESSLTGESLPVERAAGDAVLSGSINGQVAVDLRATASAADSQYSRIIALVEGAAQSRAPMVRLADRYAVPFTLLAFAIAGIAWAVSGDPVRFAEVLVVATPCPLLIAAPVAFIGGMSRAARHGIIIKGGGTLEQLSRAKTAAFDKTGTLTRGKPTLQAVQAMQPWTEDELLTLVASAEQYSSHVLAASIIDAASGRGLSLLKAATAREEATNGVVAVLGGQTVFVGKPRFIEENADEVNRIELLSGEMAVYVGIDGQFAGTLVLSDPLRENAAQTLAELRTLGVRNTLMLTGDMRATADFIAADVGLSSVQAECLPADKVEAIQRITERPVIMVGDGVNDAPVLAAADIGIAMGARGSTAASESADVVILLDDLSRTVDAVGIGKHTTRVAVQSIWLGIILSVGLMFVAGFGLIPAVAGALAQELVDVATILNALRALGGRKRIERASRATGVKTPARG